MLVRQLPLGGDMFIREKNFPTDGLCLHTDGGADQH
jgi:hypothetical protein